MFPLGLFKCESCGGTSYFSEKSESNECLCYIGFGMAGEVYVSDLPNDCIIIYRESQLEFFVKNE